MDQHTEHGGHGDHAAQFRDRFWLSLALTVPVVAYSEMVQEWLGFTPPQFPGSRWVAPVLGTVVFLYGGWPFLQGGLSEARSRQPGMMLLISLAILVGFGASAASALGLFDLEFWWELSLLIVIMLLGHWLEMRALGQASGALDALAALLPDQAERVDGDRVETVAVGDLAVGDLVLVRPGGRVPADGVIAEGPPSWTSRCSPASPARWPGSPATGWWRAPWPPTRRSGSGWRRWGRRPRSPGSAGWSSRPRRPGRGPRPWPTGRPRCCSGSPSGPG
jgi:cation transport ATPase